MCKYCLDYSGDILISYLCVGVFFWCVYIHICVCVPVHGKAQLFRRNRHLLNYLNLLFQPSLPPPQLFSPHCLVLFCSASQPWICDTLPASASWILELPAWVNMHKQCLDFWYFLLTVTFPFADGLSDENNDDRVLKCCLQYQELFPYSLVILCTWVS